VSKVKRQRSSERLPARLHPSPARRREISAQQRAWLVCAMIACSPLRSSSLRQLRSPATPFRLQPTSLETGAFDD
jgi:hypothetical protein